MCPEGSKTKGKESCSGPKVRPNRMKVSSEIPSAEVLTYIKQKKKVSGLQWVNSVLIKHIYIFFYLHN